MMMPMRCTCTHVAREEPVHWSHPCGSASEGTAIIRYLFENQSFVVVRSQFLMTKRRTFVWSERLHPGLWPAGSAGINPPVLRIRTHDTVDDLLDLCAIAE